MKELKKEFRCGLKNLTSLQIVNFNFISGIAREKGFVSLADLERACSGIKTFKANFVAMKIIAPHNSGKVFFMKRMKMKLLYGKN